MFKTVFVPKKIPYTKNGFDKLKKDLEIFQQKRPAAVLQLQTAREMGDLSENGAYKAARFELSNIDRQIRRLTHQIQFGFIQETIKTDIVDFGAKVTLKNSTKTIQFILVSGQESNPLENKYSTNSPIGRAVVGKKVGDQIIIHSPSGDQFFQLVKISSE